LYFLVNFPPTPNAEASFKNLKGISVLVRYFGRASVIDVPYRDSYLSFPSYKATPELYSKGPGIAQPIPRIS
jgi:hypothetical protein